MRPEDQLDEQLQVVIDLDDERAQRAQRAHRERAEDHDDDPVQVLLDYYRAKLQEPTP